MKYINLVMLALFSFSINSMEMAPFLKKENKIPLIHHVVKLLPKEVQNMTIAYLVKLSEYDKIQEIDILQQKIHVLAQDTLQYSFDKVTRYKNIARGAAAGTCGGCMGGTTVISTYGIVDGCVWCWCNATIPKITCNMMMWGLSGCGCVGCIVGSGCVAAGCAEKTGCLS